MTDSEDNFRASRRSVLGFAAAAAATASGGVALSSAVAASPEAAAAPESPRTGPVGFTSFINPSASVDTETFSIGAQSLIEGFVSLEGTSAKIDVA